MIDPNKKIALIALRYSEEENLRKGKNSKNIVYLEGNPPRYYFFRNLRFMNYHIFYFNPFSEFMRFSLKLYFPEKIKPSVAVSDITDRLIEENSDLNDNFFSFRPSRIFPNTYVSRDRISNYLDYRIVVDESHIKLKADFWDGRHRGYIMKMLDAVMNCETNHSNIINLKEKHI